MDDATLAEQVERYGVQPTEVDFAPPHREMVARAEQAGIDIIELSPALRARPDRAALYFRQDEHWTSLGHRVAAELLADALEQRGQLP